MGWEKIGRKACGNSVAKSERGARTENDKRKTGRKKEKRGITMKWQGTKHNDTV